MYARIVTSQFKPSSVEHAITLWQDSMNSSLRQAKGFKEAFVTGDRQTGKAVTITLWETEIDATEFDSSGLYQHSLELFKSLFTAPPSREQFEVFIQI